MADAPLASLAERLGTGERHLRRLFVDRLGAPPTGVHGTRRLLFAKQLLTDTRLPITEVALAAGFGSIRRFNAEGLAAFEDHHRSGRPATYPADEVAAVIAAALTSPRRLGLPFASWTLDRLAAYLLEHKGIAMRRSRIDEILLREGLRWRRQETWFGERVDPEFAEKRGASRRSTPHRPMAA